VTPTPGEVEALDLGILLGQRRAFTVMSGRCSAAHAEALRKIRDGKLYRAYAETWAQYCGPHLKIGRRHADRLIAQLNEFGPIFFELSALVGITPEQYRRIEPCVRNNALHIGAEAIALIPANAPEISDALTHLLRPAPRQPRRPPPRQGDLQAKLDSLEARGRDLAAEFETLAASSIPLRERERVLDVARSVRLLLGSLEHM